jgi:hypothetical protein
MNANLVLMAVMVVDAEPVDYFNTLMVSERSEQPAVALLEGICAEASEMKFLFFASTMGYAKDP